MNKRSFVSLPIIAIMCASQPAGAMLPASTGYKLQLTVPVICSLKHQPGIAPSLGGGYELGELLEYCNAPTGYAVTVNYVPGSMRGAVVSVGEERVILDGSGSAVVSRAAGPRIRDRTIVVVPGQSGFDTERLDFNIIRA